MLRWASLSLSLRCGQRGVGGLKGDLPGITVVKVSLTMRVLASTSHLSSFKCAICRLTEQRPLLDWIAPVCV